MLNLQDFQGASSAAAAKAMRAELAKLSSQIQDEEARKVKIFAYPISFVGSLDFDSVSPYFI
jgi:hypothetical protein